MLVSERWIVIAVLFTEMAIYRNCFWSLIPKDGKLSFLICIYIQER